MSAAEVQKQAVGEAAAELVESGMRVGLGSGSTAAFFVRALASRRLDIRCVATSEATAHLAASLGLRLFDLDEVERLDLTVDGADEVGPELALIKGGGGALLREKLVWEASARCVVIADHGKMSDVLGRYPLPVEIIGFGARHTQFRLKAALAELELSATPELRTRGGAPVRTDTGNVIVDIPCRTIANPERLAAKIKGITGVVEHGLFLGLAKLALVGADRGVTRLTA
ncbi:MAG TPA: ribose-5-phosphate isomerase RpiA [Caulobacteraceae bacterium]|nr:ribose-5-phosphate isomerase RpiA [Caulobacteraceae bacterium]